MMSRLFECGVPCTLQVWEIQVHAFPAIAAHVPEALEATHAVAEFALAAVAAHASDLQSA